MRDEEMQNRILVVKPLDYQVIQGGGAFGKELKKEPVVC